MNNNKRVLVFDDNKAILELCIYLLQEAGYNIKTSQTALEVEKQVQSYMPHLILMDNGLPGLTGIEATNKLKANQDLKHIPIIFFSAHNNISILSEQAGADDYLAKPFEIKALENILDRYLK